LNSPLKRAEALESILKTIAPSDQDLLAVLGSFNSSIVGSEDEILVCKEWNRRSMFSLQEADINFPAVVYSKYSGCCIIKKTREFQGWPDRIMFSNNNKIDIIGYTSAPFCQGSDHPPVACIARFN
jgi:hypothetical protein